MRATSVSLSPDLHFTLSARGALRVTLEACLLVAVAVGDYDEQLRAAKERAGDRSGGRKVVVNVRLSPALEAFKVKLARDFGNFSAWAEAACRLHFAEARIVLYEFNAVEREELEAAALRRYSAT